MTQIINLPTEVLAHLLSYLPIKDFPGAAGTCRLFHAAIEIESLWKIKCRQDFGVTVYIGQNVSCRDIYTKLLYRYGRILGLWYQIEVPYGGLCCVSFHGDKIHGYEFKAPKGYNVEKPLRKKHVFSVKIDEQGYAGAACHRGYVGDHHCIATIQPHPRLYYRCGWREYHSHPNGPTAHFHAWMEEHMDESGDPAHTPHNLIRFLTDQRNDQSIEAERLVLPSAPSNALIQPGLFKGTYGSHGIEMLLLSYSPDRHTLIAKKITGDPNIPAKQISIEVDLLRPMLLTSEQQASLDVLSEIDIPDLPPDTNVRDLPAQPFFVPATALLGRSSTQPPSQCKARFHSRGQIADDNFENPTFIPGHCVFFNENTFGHLWLSLESFSMYSRVTEDFNVDRTVRKKYNHTSLRK